MADWSRYKVSAPTNKWDRYRVQEEAPASPTLPELPSPFGRQLPRTQPTKSVGWTPFDSNTDAAQSAVGARVAPFVENAADPLSSSDESFFSPWGIAGTIAGLGGVGLIAKGLRGLKKGAKAAAAIIPEVLPPEIIPGKRRLAAAAEPKGLLGPAINPELIPGPPEVSLRNFPDRGFSPEQVENPFIIKPPEEVTLGRNQIAVRGSTPPPPQSTGVPDVVVPNRLKPVTPAEESFNALIPERFKRPNEMMSPNGELQFGSSGPVGEKVTLPPELRFDRFGAEAASLPDIQAPPIRIEARTKTPYGGYPTVDIPTPNTYPKTGPQVTITNPTGKKAKKIIKEAKAITDTVNKVAKQVPEYAEVVKYPSVIEEAARRQTLGGKLKQFGRNWGRAIEAEFEGMGKAGRQIKLMMANASVRIKQRAAIWDAPYDDMIKQLSPQEQVEFFNVMNGTGTSASKKVNKFVAVAEQVDAQRIGLAQKIGVKNAETGETMKPMGKYAPRIYPEGFWENPKNIYEGLKKRFPKIDDALATEISLGKANPEIADRVMKSAGVDRATADLILKLGRERGERTIASQHARKLDLPGYRTDANVWKEHNLDMAKRTSEQEIFGQMDIADPNSPISKLIAQTPNPRYSEDLLKIVLGRDEKDRWARNLDKVNRVAGNLSSAMYLSLFPISNTANLLTTTLHAGFGNTIKALKDTVISARGTTRAFATESGAIYNITRGILEGGTGPIAKGVSISENFNRTVSANAGKLAAQDLFDTLKSGKLSPANRKFIEDLLLTSPDELMKQSSLTKQQLLNAGGRMAELTQGLNEARKVPVYWNSPYLQIPLIFKKFAFQQTGALKEAIKRDPIKTIPLLFGAAQIMGEAIGDTKAFIRGGVKSLISGEEKVSEEVKGRQDYLGQYLPVDNPVVLRMVDNLMQSWALGLASDLFFMSTGDARSMAYELAGPAAGTALTAVEATRKAVTGEPAMLGRETLKRVPYIGSGLQKGLMPTKFQQNQSKDLKLPQLYSPKD